MRLRKHAESRIHRDPDHNDVAYRPEAWPLPQRNPQQQHERTDPDDNPAERPSGLPGEALMQHVPGLQAKPGADQQCYAHAEQGKPGVQAEQPARESAAGEFGRRSANDARRPGCR